jgi:hypothetical protein
LVFDHEATSLLKPSICRFGMQENLKIIQFSGQPSQHFENPMDSQISDKQWIIFLDDPLYYVGVSLAIKKDTLSS